MEDDPKKIMAMKINNKELEVG